MSELKPCPFCGKVDELYSIPRFLEITKGETKEIEWAVGCKRCDVHLYRARYAKDEGIATWNTRPIEDELRAEITRLKEENHALDQINRDIQTAAAHLDEVLAELARRDEQISTLVETVARLKEDGERLAEHYAVLDDGHWKCKYCHYHYVPDGKFHSNDCPITLHRALMKELE